VLAGRTKYPPLKFWAVRIDLKNPALEIVLTPPPVPEQRKYTAPPLPYGSIYSTKVSSFARANRCLAALNAGPFWPVTAREREERTVTGIFIADGTRFADNAPQYGALVFYQDGRAAIVVQSALAGGTEAVQNAAGGFFTVLDSGEVGRHVFNRTARHPRSAAGLSADGRFLYLLAIDGRWFDTIGATEAETGLLLSKLGAYNGLNLDGGGSTALALQNTSGGIFILNRPIHKQIPGKERAVATCIGIRRRLNAPLLE
jgi:exopolysaccharide biosynthesis protein